MRRDFYPRRKSDRGHAKPEKFSSEKQNHRADEDAEDGNWQIHSLVMSSGNTSPARTETSLDVSEVGAIDPNRPPLPFPKGEDEGEGLLRLLLIPLRQISAQQPLQLFDVEIENVDQARSQLISDLICVF